MKILTDKWIHVLDSLNKTDKSSVTNIAKGLDVTYTHILKIIVLLKKKNIVTAEKVGRVRVVTLTRKGRKLANHCTPLVEFVSNM